MQKVRLHYIDLLKVFSIFAIISIHTFMIWRHAQIMNIDIYGFCEIWRFGVPVFIMISGALLLNREIEIKSFFKKKVNRLVYPFIFFYILTALFCFAIGAKHPQVSNIFEFRWYFWMILGVYISIPVINKFVLHSSIKEIEYFLVVFVVASVFYQITHYFEIEQFLYLTLFVSPLGYLILGYYLSVKNFDMSVNKIVTIAAVLFLLSSFVKACSMCGFIPNVDDFIVNQSKVLSSWVDVGIFEIIQASSIFVLFKYIYQARDGIYSYVRRFLESNVISKFVVSVSKASYGMYLINLIPTLMCYRFLLPLKLTGTQVCITIFLTAVTIFVATWIVVLILSKIPFIGKLSGYA